MHGPSQRTIIFLLMPPKPPPRPPSRGPLPMELIWAGPGGIMPSARQTHQELIGFFLRILMPGSPDEILAVGPQTTYPQ